jgi:hypothetical protein
MTGSILTASGSAEARALGEAITSLRQTPGGPEQLANQLDLLTARCRAFPEETRRLWDWFQAQQPCATVDDLREVFEGHLALLDERIRLVKEVQNLAAERDASSQDAPLAEALSDLAAQRSRIAGIWKRMIAPLPPSMEPEWTTADCRAALERGEYETIESIIARVEAGGPVGKDDAE